MKSDNFREPTKHQHWPEHRPSNRYNQLDVADASNHVLDRPSSTHNKDLGAKDTTIMVSSLTTIFTIKIAHQNSLSNFLFH